MNAFDIVELIREREEYTKEGFRLGDRGEVVVRQNGMCCVSFGSEVIWFKGVPIERDKMVDVLEEDLRIVTPADEDYRKYLLDKYKRM